LDAAGSFIVQAPAGSGKTELLIQRFLTLLARVDRPEAVLAITFTNKAAGEMRLRVVAALRDAAGVRPAEEHAALTWELARAVRTRSDDLGWELDSNPGRLQIRTIDSLCAWLVRQMPWLSRVGAAPGIVEDPRELYQDAARQTIELLEAGEWSDAVEALLIHLDNDLQKLRSLLADLLAQRDQWLRHIGSGAAAGEVRAALEAGLRNAVLDGVDRVRALVPAELTAEIVAVVASSGQNLLDAGRDGAATACAGMDGLPDAEDLERWLGILETLLKKDDDWREKLTIANGFPAKSTIKARAEALLAALSACEAFRSALADLRWLPQPRFSEPQWAALQALIELLPVAAAQLQVRFRSGGETDYSEIGLAARHALGEPEAPTDLALALDFRIQHLLVDEFQDTSVSQFALLEKLTAGWEPGDGRTIFAVGDPMQSIYRFREAEVGLFLKAAREGIGSVPLRLLRLTANFRSDRQIVDWVNETFPAVLPAAEDITTSAIPFAPSIPVRPERPEARVELYTFIGRDDAAEAARAAELARDARARGRKVAILVRARSHLAAVIPALRAADLRFRAVEIDSLATLPMIRDLVSLTRALAHPADRIAWLAMLRAPWCGVSLADLHVIAGDGDDAPLWDAIRDEERVARLATEARARVERFRAAIGGAVAERASSLRARVEGVWLALGGPACAAGPADRENAAAFFDLLEALDDGALPDPAALAARIQDLYANPDPEADDSIQVMSIHKAKGLEFEAVIVPGLGRKPRGEDARLLLWLERPRLGGTPDLMMAPIQATGADADPIYEYLKKVDAIKARHEAGWLLYVAATRAKSELHLLGHAAFDAKGNLKAAPGSLLERMWTVARPRFEGPDVVAAPAPDEVVMDLDRAPQILERLALDWTLPAPPPRAPSPALPPVQEGTAAVSFRWVGDTLRHVGTVVHRMLRRIALDGPASWDAGRVQGARGSIRAALLALGVAVTEVPSAADSVVAALVGALDDVRGMWVLRGGDGAECEYALSGVVHGEIVHARVDRTFVDAAGVRWIIDYKTSVHEGAGADAFLDAECERYRPQLERYRHLFATLEDCPVRTALYFPLLRGWREVAPLGANAAIQNRED
jgi:ATP-dependent exoDNAse (exonuclease V) beta subunit